MKRIKIINNKNININNNKYICCCTTSKSKGKKESSAFVRSFVCPIVHLFVCLNSRKKIGGLYLFLNPYTFAVDQDITFVPFSVKFYSMKKISEMKVADLKKELTKRGLDTTGLKAVLKERLVEAVEKEASEEKEAMSEEAPADAKPEESKPEEALAGSKPEEAPAGSKPEEPPVAAPAESKPAEASAAGPKAEEGPETDDEPEQLAREEEPEAPAALEKEPEAAKDPATVAEAASVGAETSSTNKRKRDDAPGAENGTGNAPKRMHMDGASAAQYLGGSAPANRLPAEETVQGDLVTITIQVPARHIGAVIGRGGQNIKMLRERTRTSVQVPKDPTGRANTRLAIIEGMRHNVEMARQRIESTVADRERESQNQPVADMFAPGNTTKEIHIPNAQVGGIIGRGGHQIKLLREQARCEIQVQSNRDVAPGSDRRRVTLIGSPDKVALAERLILAKVEELAANVEPRGHSQPSSYGGGGGGGGGGGMNDRTEQVSVPSEHVGRIIGKGGSMIKSIRERSNCDVQVERDNGPPGPTRVVTFRGTPEAINQAKFLVSQKLVDPMQQGGYGGGGGGGGYGGNGYGGGGGYGGGSYGGGYNQQQQYAPPPSAYGNSGYGNSGYNNGGGYGYGQQQPPPSHHQSQQQQQYAPPPATAQGGYGYGAQPPQQQSYDQQGAAQYYQQPPAGQYPPQY